MIHEYAVDPASLQTFNEIWQALEQFGVSHGRVIVQCPKRWWAIVKEHLQSAEASLPPVAYKMLEERCNRLRESRKIIRRRNLKFDGEKPFAEALQAEHSERPFRALVQLDPNPGSQVPVLSRWELHDQHPLWQVNRTPVVSRDGLALAKSILPLVRVSNEVMLVDPYFASDPVRFQIVPELFRVAHESGCHFSRIHVHTSTKGSKTFVENAVRSAWGRLLPETAEIWVQQWCERPGGERLHDRFLLTDLGGIQSSFGWDNGDAGQTTNLSLLDEEAWQLRVAQYRSPAAAFQAVGDPFEISGIRRYLD